LRNTLVDDNASCTQLASRLVDQRGAFINQIFSKTLNPLDILLPNGFYRHHPFVRASDRVIGCCGIVKVVLIADYNLLHYSTL